MFLSCCLGKKIADNFIAEIQTLQVKPSLRIYTLIIRQDEWAAASYSNEEQTSLH